MAVYFLDSSALVKRYIRETGTDWVSSLFSPDLGNDCFVVAIAGVEIVSAITRRARSGSIKLTDAALACTQFKQDFQATYQVIEITEDIIQVGMSLAETRGLRGYDAVQLAAGCAVNALCLTSGLPPLIFVSADNELNAAASSEGLAVENPNER
ncbi:type II toxin-antitoxin system VapC family toxin [Nodosilinea sp. P-1105]|uniref:type II toxin-antitoxin system VapC family toxin n=1 Tax=Nodosilinea sp. P-1105 TaxID=2546229 RepID=UPI00146CC108|nr:type II toxin-antitoxin system VapC family toxin [Nodosilinea sp. P-1105]NMF86273.1 nucleic acid-binding protein [Nodosilinea sp. P-1105]